VGPRVPITVIDAHQVIMITQGCQYQPKEKGQVIMA